jgi:hypothetical protein
MNRKRYLGDPSKRCPLQGVFKQEALQFLADEAAAVRIGCFRNAMLICFERRDQKARPAGNPTRLDI